MAGGDKVFGRAVHEVEVVRRVVQVAFLLAVEVGFPVETQPLHRVEDGVHVLLFFLLGVGVVKAHVADAAVVARQAEVQADALGVAHVQVAVGFGREAGADLGRVGLAGVVEGGITRAAAPLALGVGAGGEVFSMTWRRKFDVLSAWPSISAGAWWCREMLDERDGGMQSF